MSSPILSAGRVAIALLLVARVSVAAPPADTSKRDHDSGLSPLILKAPLAGAASSGAAAPASAAETAGGAYLDSVARQQRLFAAQLRAEVDSALREARTTTSHSAVVQDLRLLRERVRRASGLPAAARAELRAKLDAGVRDAQRRSAMHETVAAEGRAARAATADAAAASAAQENREQRLRQLADRFQSLIENGRHSEAQRVASDYMAAVAAQSPVAVAAQHVADQTAAHEFNQSTRRARQSGVVGTLAVVEAANVPRPDDEPFVYPAAWDELSRRRAGFANVDNRTVGPAEAKIRRQLGAPTSLDFIEAPLTDIVSYLKDLHGIEIQLDTKALEDAGRGGDLRVTADMQNVSLRSALRHTLRPLDLSFVVEDDVLVITTVDVADLAVERRVYPVEDIVMPVAPANSGAGGPALGSFAPQGMNNPSPVGAGVDFFNGPGANGRGQAPGLNPQGNAPF
ncbi:MAG: hypothetical protein AB7O59_20225 [Pirellulales bacterium]